MTNSWRNEAGEPFMTASELRFEADLDAQYDEERWYDEQDEDDDYEADEDDNLTDVEADAMTLASAGMGTDEDYGYFGEDNFDIDYGETY